MKSRWIWVAVIIALLPFCYNIIATTPVLDDICYFTYIHNHTRINGCVIAEEPPQWARFSPIISFLTARYIGWSGRFTSDMLIASWLTIPIDIVTSYSGVLYVLFVIYCVALYMFFRAFLPTPSRAMLSSLLVILLTFLLNPDVAESEYWITAIFTYRMAVLFGACLCVYLYYLFRSSSRITRSLSVRMLHYCALFFGGVLLCGFNESYMLLAVFLSVALLVAVYRSANRGFAIALSIGVMIGALIVFASPGNGMRIATEQSALANRVPLTLLLSGMAALFYSVMFCFLLLLAHTFAPFRAAMGSIYKHNPTLFQQNALPHVILCVVYFCIPMIYIAPLVWGVGGIGPLRAHGQIILTLLLYSPFLYNSILVLYTRHSLPPLLHKTIRYMNKILTNRSLTGKIIRSTMITIFCALVFFGIPAQTQSTDISDEQNLIVAIDKQNIRIVQSILIASNEYFSGNGLNSYRDMFLNTNRYRRELRQRHALLLAAAKYNAQTVTVPPLSSPPKTVFVRGLDSYPSEYNMGYMRMYAGESAVIPVVFPSDD